MLLRVSQAFYSLSQAEILLGTNVQQAQLTAKQLNKLEALYRQGLKTKREFFRLKSQAQRAAIEVSNAKVARRNAEIELRRTMGVPADATGITFVTLTTDDIQAHDPDVPTQVPTVQQSYQAKITEYQNAIGEDNIELARRRNLPVLTVGSGLNYQVPDYMRVQAGTGTPDAPNSWTWNVTVGVNYNIWDAGSRRRDIDIAASQRLIQNRDNRDKLFARAAEIAKLMETLRNLKGNLQLNKELMRLEQSNIAILEEDYRQGKVAYLDLVTGLSDLLSARVSYYTNYISILTAMAQYRYYEGTIYETVANS
jgi:outer membrane protein TolC